MQQPHQETPIEERLSTITHGIGIPLSLAALTVLVTFASLYGDPRHIVTLSLYGTSLVLVYLASTLFHACPAGRAKHKHWLRVFDHSAIYGLIAGTYTPFLLVLIGGGWGWSLFGVLWGLAAVGVILKLFFVNRFEVLSVAIYIALGWIGIIFFRPVLLHLPGEAVAWILGGGAAYTAGILFFFWDRLPFNHAIWHLFVLAGSACHFMAVLLHVAPLPR